MRTAPDLVGHALDGRYELRELIGEGTFGRVYRGYDRRLAREVAIKVIKPWWSEDPEWAESFGREAQLLARVSDPGIVQIFDVGEAEEGRYYVTELVDGESLAALLRRGGALAPWRACEIAEQICRALERAHAKQIVHRDIKPANVLISSLGRVKVGDLGVARLAEGTTDGGTATIVGTPRYMAPEQANGQPVSPATDVYSAGIVLYEMLAGRPPFNGDSAVEIALRHVQEPAPPLPAGTPWSLEQVALRALAKEPADRYQSAAEMAAALADARAGSTRSPTAMATGTGENEAEEILGAVRRRLDGSTWIAPEYSPRRNVNPAARRRSVAVFALALGLLLAMAVATKILTGPAKVQVPGLHGGRRQVDSVLKRLDLHASFFHAFNGRVPSGAVVSQSPAPRARVNQGSTVQVVLSRGPRPIDVPSLKGQTSSAAAAQLNRSGLNDQVSYVPAPGIAPGIVTGQSPTVGTQLHRHATVTLLVAETPTWRFVTSFSGGGGGGGGQSIPFHIRGTQWRIVYSMSYQGTCDFVFWCNGPSAEVLGAGSTNVSFSLNDGGGQTRVFKTGPGDYQVAIKPGWDSANWSIQVQDYY
ncbi:MAG TPA: protein kinase [Solirubrobacteraceae bacterium]|nr:protein kinase [Solirubrobacteraceae bacterium]